jgi:hypothetical protein
MHIAGCFTIDFHPDSIEVKYRQLYSTILDVGFFSERAISKKLNTPCHTF